MSNMSRRAQPKKISGMYQQISNPRSRPQLGAKKQDPNFGPGYRSLYIRIEEKRPIFKFSPRYVCLPLGTDKGFTL